MDRYRGSLICCLNNQAALKCMTKFQHGFLFALTTLASAQVAEVTCVASLGKGPVLGAEALSQSSSAAQIVAELCEDAKRAVAVNAMKLNGPSCARQAAQAHNVHDSLLTSPSTAMGFPC
jgi:hypothetical protein